MHRYFDAYAGDVGLRFDELMDRGRRNQGDPSERFNMAVLAFRHARYINGVSKLHGVVSRQMAQSSFADLPLNEVPVGSVTNGIHTRSFLSGEMADLQDRYLGEPTAENLADPAFWAKVDDIPDAELWATHEMRRKKLVEWARKYQVAKLEKRGAADRELAEATEILDPNILTIGFARRFATYKRGDLLLRDVERIKRIINNPDRPVQFVFAGKAHPKDDAGKELIRHIVHFSRDEDVRRRIVFLEDYDMAMARYLVEGVDVWLNNPRRPMEASGTSGMKVIANGGLNFSVLDGWWAEAYDASVGWEIGRGEDYEDLGYQDHVEAEDIYATLEREIVPLFYKRDLDDVPTGWVAKMKVSMKRLAPVYTTARMVREYAETYYVPAARRVRQLAENDFARAKALVLWKQKVRQAWRDVRVASITADQDRMMAGQEVPVHAVIHLGSALTPGDVAVQLYAGPVDADRNLTESNIVPLTPEGPAGDGIYNYFGLLPTAQSGQNGFTVRVLPFHPDAVLPQELPLVSWE
jgi:starch phosphorylase